jgi:hypothetical protein
LNGNTAAGVGNKYYVLLNKKKKLSDYLAGDVLFQVLKGWEDEILNTKPKYEWHLIKDCKITI